MDNKVIEILDYMGEKIGIAIDWTAENVWPQVIEFMSRYQTYAIVDCVIGMVLSLIGLVVSFLLIKSMVRGYKKKGSVWRDDTFSSFNSPSFLCIIMAIISAIVVGISIFTLFGNISEVIKWAIVPEIQFFETFSEYLK